MSQYDTGYSHHQSYNNRFRSSSSDNSNNNATTTAATTSVTTMPKLSTALEGVLDEFGESTNFGQLSLLESEHEDPRSKHPQRTVSQEQPRDCSEIIIPCGTNGIRKDSDSQNNPADANVPHVPAPTAPGKPRRLSRQMSAGAKRQNFVASRSLSGGNHSIDSAKDDVFVELDVEGVQDLHGQRPQPPALYDSSLFPSGKVRAAQILSTSSSIVLLPNPYNRLNHKLHDAVWLCQCLYLVFFCCLPALHYMEQSDRYHQLDDPKTAKRLATVSTVLFFVGALLTLLFFSLIFFLAIYFSTQ